MSDEWQINFYRQEDGKLPVQEFLKASDLMPGELKQLQLRLKLLRSYGLRLLRERSDILSKLRGQDKLYELRLDNTPNNPRIFLCALTGKRLALLHGFKKKSQKTPKGEIKIAVSRQKRLVALEESKHE